MIQMEIKKIIFGVLKIVKKIKITLTKNKIYKGQEEMKKYLNLNLKMSYCIMKKY